MWVLWIIWARFLELMFSWLMNHLRPMPAEVVYFDRLSFEGFLASLEPGSRFAVELAMTQILPWARQIESSKWVKALVSPLMQFRIGPTTASVLTRSALPAGRIATRQPLLVRVFFVFEGESRIVVLHAYDKTGDRTRLSQQREMAIARQNLELWVKANS